MNNNLVINVNKPQNMTSHDVVNIMRKLLKTKKVGHTGTLDPMAEGVLPICINRSTKVIEYFEADFKTYVCDIALGIKTDTDDIWGKVVGKTSYSHITREDIEAVMLKFLGEVFQVPPIYSSLKVKGKRLYEYARNGEKVEIKPRKIWIEEFDIMDIDLDKGTIKGKITCSKGTYIRAICRDFGEKLGTYGTMTSLKRTRSGAFNIETSYDIEELKGMTEEEIIDISLAPEDSLVNLGKIFLREEMTRKFLNGMKISARDYSISKKPFFAMNKFPLELKDIFFSGYKVYGIVDGKEEFLGVGKVIEETKSLKVEKMIFLG